MSLYNIKLKNIGRSKHCSEFNLNTMSRKLARYAARRELRKHLGSRDFDLNLHDGNVYCVRSGKLSIGLVVITELLTTKEAEKCPQHQKH